MLEYVPTTIPTAIAEENERISGPPRSSSATTAIIVVPEVNIVRESV